VAGAGVVSVEVCVSGAAEEAEGLDDERDLLVVVTLFDELFVVLLTAVSGARDALDSAVVVVVVVVTALSFAVTAL